jgi:hypothetical protein
MSHLLSFIGDKMGTFHTHSDIHTLTQDRKWTYNLTFEGRSDIFSVKLMNEMAMASLAWQPQRALISGAGDTARYSQ